MNSNKHKVTLFWFRRDLRLFDNTGLYQALKAHDNVLPLFIFDSSILTKLEDKSDARVTFIYDALMRLKLELEQNGSTVLIKHGKPIDVYAELKEKYEIEAVYANHDYEPYAKQRDLAIHETLDNDGIRFFTFKDQVIFEAKDVVKADGLPYTVFTPYSKKWKDKLREEDYQLHNIGKYITNFKPIKDHQELTLKDLGFERSQIKVPLPEINSSLIKEYADKRDIPSFPGTSKLSVHLRFGTISIRSLVKVALKTSEVWLNELIWREFYQMILWHFPDTDKAFKSKYDRIEWRKDEEQFHLWCEGKTGYPIVDAGMRELNETGFMHNRVRMVVASFLTKHLLLDWRWGEAYFAQKLLDFDLAANNGGWQWAAGTGCDAAPYFRIFNPYTQTKKFDPELKYIRKWVPEFDDPFKYPQPIVEHTIARERCLRVYKEGLSDA